MNLRIHGGGGRFLGCLIGYHLFKKHIASWSEKVHSRPVGETTADINVT